MGYYSHVAFTIRGKKEDIIPVLMEHRLNGGVKGKEALDSCGYVDDGTHMAITFEDESTKWYDSFNDVQALTELYDAFSDEAKFECNFVRLGEDAADVESRASGNDPYDLVRMVRTIEMQYAHDTDNTLEELCQTLKSPTNTTP